MSFENNSESARAKINLTLQILGKRKDGYHEIMSLVAFATLADVVRFSPNVTDYPFSNESLRTGCYSLEISGPFANCLEGENLLLKAARALKSAFSQIPFGHIHLIKNLPVSAGIGGGSADAAALIRLFANRYDLDLQSEKILALAQSLGADVPVCLRQRPVLMAGLGEKLYPLSGSDFPQIPCVLVNPNIPVATADIFRRLNAKPYHADETTEQEDVIHPSFKTLSDVIGYMAARNNDLQIPSIDLAPIIADVLQNLREQAGCCIARMSGSGATCYGLFSDQEAASNAALKLKSQKNDWWVMETSLE